MIKSMMQGRRYSVPVKLQALRSVVVSEKYLCILKKCLLYNLITNRVGASQIIVQFYQNKLIEILIIIGKYNKLTEHTSFI